MYGVLTDEEVVGRLNEIKDVAGFDIYKNLPEVINLLIEYEKTYEDDYLFFNGRSVTGIVKNIFHTLTKEAQDSGRYSLCDEYNINEDKMYSSVLEDNMREQVLYDGIVHYYKRNLLPEEMDLGSLASLCRYLFEYIKKHTYSEYEEMLELAKKRV